MNGNCSAHNYPLQHTPGGNRIASFSCQCSASHQVVEQLEWASTADLQVVYNQPQPDFPVPSDSPQIQSTVTPPVIITQKKLWQCRICPELSRRQQERDRHELTHVPYFLHCPLARCAWRGNRADSFKKHWQREDHRSHHEHYGHTPERSQIETFDPWAVLLQISNGAISLREEEDLAIFLVQVKAYELQKTDIWTDSWGRKKRH